MSSMSCLDSLGPGLRMKAEAITPRLWLASAAILGGIALVLASKARTLRVPRPS